jgi:hypothetical protein
MNALLGLLEGEGRMEQMLDMLLETLEDYIPTLAGIAVMVVLLAFSQRLLLSGLKSKGAEARLPRQLMMLALTLCGLFVILLLLPMEATTRGDVIRLIGVLFTAVIALSSATFVSNAMAGMMVRKIKCFRLGDFVRVKEEFGRITERGLFHIELQTEDGDLTTLPNLYMITNPVSVVRNKGTVISATVSLGYDEPRDRVETLLKMAAKEVNLTDAFVHVLKLGDFSILYKIAGFSTDVKSMLTTRSNLRKGMLDALHDANVEIMSPTFMTQRQIGQDDAMIPTRTHRVAKSRNTGEPVAEDVIFEKADRAAGLEVLKDRHAKLMEELAQVSGKKAKGEEKERLSERREELISEAAKLIEQIDESAKGLLEEDGPAGK